MGQNYKYLFKRESGGVFMISNYENDTMNESMVEAYIIETRQQIENIEEALLQTEKLKYFEPQKIDEIFRCMHSIKGASSMMMYDNIANVAHKVEDLFYFIRENPDAEYDVESLIDVIFEGVDFLSFELDKVKERAEISEIPQELIEHIVVFLDELKSGKQKVKEPKKVSSNTYYHAKVKFLPDCEMENLRAFAMVHALGDISKQLKHIPEELADNPDASEQIRNNGFELFIETSADYSDIQSVFSSSVFLDNFEIDEVGSFGISEANSNPNIEMNANNSINDNIEISGENTELVIRFLKDLFESKSKNMDVNISINLKEAIDLNSSEVFDIAQNYGLIDDSSKQNIDSGIVLYSFRNNKFDNKIELKLNVLNKEMKKSMCFESIIKARDDIKKKDNIDVLSLVEQARKSDVEASRELIVMVSRNRGLMPDLPKQIKSLLENQDLFNQVKSSLENREGGVD